MADPAIGVFIVVNAVMRAVRRRFSFAHEYAHALLDRDRLGTVSRTTERDDLSEVRANAFAAAFLLPAEGVRQFMTLDWQGRAESTASRRLRRRRCRRGIHSGGTQEPGHADVRRR